MTAAHVCAAIGFAAGITAGSSAFAQSNDPGFGNRIDKPDGSSTLTIGRRLETEWDTRLGMDAKLAPELASPTMSDTILHTPGSNRSTGAIWGTVTGPSVAPMLFDKTSVDARVDPSEEKGQFAATLSRTVPLGDDVSITVQDKYSVMHSLQGNANAAWEADRSVRLNLAPTSTTLSAGIVTSSTDQQMRNKLSAEQKIGGPLTVTTTITDPGTSASGKSITAGFKHTW